MKIPVIKSAPLIWGFSRPTADSGSSALTSRVQPLKAAVRNTALAGPRDRSAAAQIRAALPADEGESPRVPLYGAASWRAHLAHYGLALPQQHRGFNRIEAGQIHTALGVLIDSGSIAAGIRKACTTDDKESFDAIVLQTIEIHRKLPSVIFKG